MTTVEIPVPDVRKGLRWLWSILGVALLTVTGGAGKVLRTKARPAASQLTDHIYTIIGFGMVVVAFWHFGWFWGPLATGIAFILFEWKVSEE